MLPGILFLLVLLPGCVSHSRVANAAQGGHAIQSRDSGGIARTSIKSFGYSPNVSAPLILAS